MKYKKYETAIKSMKKWKNHINHQQLHACFKVYENYPSSPIVKKCFEDEEGKVWIENDKTQDRGDFCPYCGFKAPTPMKEKTREIYWKDLY